MAGTTEIQLSLVDSLDEAMAMKRWLGERHENGWIAADTETQGLDWWRDGLRTVQFGDRHRGWCMEWGDWAGLVKECFRDYDGPIAMHNCFSGDTAALTPDGPMPLRDLAAAGQATVWTRDGWREATAGSGGVQPLQDIVLHHTKSRSRLTQTVRATPNHRWELRDGSLTRDLKPGDQIPAEVPAFERDELGYLHGLIYADGTKLKHVYQTGEMAFQIRLCGWKNDEAWRMHTGSRPPSMGGDMLGVVRSRVDLKELPTADQSAEYKASFIEGWAHFDGTERPSGVVVITMADNKADESAQWLVDNASDYGWLVTGDFSGKYVGEYTRQDGDGHRRMVTLTKDTTKRWWTVRSITPAEPEEVFCVNVPEIERFTLAGGIYTSNSKFDVHFLESNGVPLKRWLIHDTRAMAHLLDPVRRTGLKPKASEVLGPWANTGESDLKQAMLQGGYDWKTIPIELLWQYAAFDTVLTAQLAAELYPRIAAGYSEIYDLELASTQVLGDMETRGILTDRRYLLERASAWGGQVEEIQQRLRSEFRIGNAASNAQVIRYLQDDLGWKPIVFTEKGAISLEADVLRGIGHPAADLVLEHRTLHLLASYVGQHLELAESNGRLHCSINPLGARTGRMSASRPSLQNIPKDDNRIRNGFTVDSGNVLISADYDQIEGRLFAHYSGDQNMLQSIRYGDNQAAQGLDGYDMHSMAARMVFGIPLDQPVPKKLRSRTKTVQFGKIYGSGLEKFAATSGLSLEQAQEVINRYEAEFPETRKIGGFQGRITERLIERERAEGEAYVMTAYGRKEPCFPSKAYRAVNYLIQGTAADVLKSQLVALSKTWLGSYMVLPIHDEILFELPEEARYEAIRVIREVMPERSRFSVPLTVDVETKYRWGGDPIEEMRAA